VTGDPLEVGALVVLCCLNPKEKLWGCLLRLDANGVVVRGLDLGSVDDWLAQEKSGEPALIVPSTVFVPMHRVQRIYCDETTAAVASYADRYRMACGRDVRQVLHISWTAVERPADDDQGEVS
jgi:hypothetical protein